MTYKNQEEFLLHYDMNKYERPTGYTSDIVIFTLVDLDEIDTELGVPKKQLQVMLIKRAYYPEKGKWALPGGFVTIGETAYEAAKRELEEETGVSGIYLKHLGVYDSYGRDPRGNKWVISNAHYAIVNSKYLLNRKAGTDASDVKLFNIEDVKNMDLAFDHKKIIMDAFELVKKEMLQTTLAKEFLDDEFTLSELFSVLKSVSDFKTYKSNFFTRAQKLPFLEVVRDENGNIKKTAKYSKRHARLYRFVDVDIFPSIY